IKLIRDLISWAKDLNKEIPEFKQNEGIKLDVAVTNNTDKSADKVILTLIDPDRNIIDTQTMPTSILPHQKISTLYSLLSPPYSPGTWWIDYELQDNAGNTIQPQTEGERFTVSKHITSSTRLDGYKIWAVADEHTAKGSKVAYTIFVRNDTDKDFNGNIGIGVHEEKASGGRWWANVGVIPNITLPAHSQKSFVFERNVNISTATYFGLFPLNANYETFFLQEAIAVCEKGVRVIDPAVDMQVTTNKKAYSKGDKVNLELNLKNKTEVKGEFSANLRIFNPDNAVIFATTTALTLTSKGSVSLTYNLNLPLDAIEGIYIIQAEANSNNQRIGLDTTYFEILEGILGLEVGLPETITPYSTNTISFTLKNPGLAVIESSPITVSFMDTNRILLYQRTFPTGSVAIGGSVTTNIDIPIKGIDFGIYELFYTMSYAGKTLAGSKKIKCSAITKIDLDKPSYRVRDEIKQMIELINIGKFREELQVVSFIDDCNFSTTTRLSLLPNQKGTISFSLPIPATFTAGYHYGTVSTMLGSSTINKQFSFYIPEARVDIDIGKINYLAGDEVNINIANTGGVDAGYEYEIRLVDSRYCKVYEKSGNDSIPAGSTETVSFDISSQLVSGDYNLIICRTGTGNTPPAPSQEGIIFQKLIHIQGISAEMELTTDNQNYLQGETITATAKIENTGLGDIENGTLTFKVFKNISKISNDVVEFGFNDSGVINHASFVGGENLLDEFQVGIRENEWGTSSL
ncbi:MAG: hypothetical protein AAB296_09470, partial [Candidatus Desantisbacteria bacterium]